MPENLDHCLLCGNLTQVRESHIWPSFCVRWLQKHTGSPYIRSAENPNIRKQDVIKERMLGDCCEQKFSRWEDKFARNLFKDYNDSHQLKNFEYGDWLIKLAISLSWRSSHSWMNILEIEKPFFVPFVKTAQEDWRELLLGKHQKFSIYEHHLLFLHNIDFVSLQDSQMSEKWKTYSSLGFDMGFIAIKSRILIYTMVPGFAFISAVRPQRLSTWKNTKILKEGKFAKNPDIADRLVMDWIADRANIPFEHKFSERQQTVIEEAARQHRLKDQKL